jgi:uncharacterized repeat protein (TIGR01451 family)
MEKGIVILRRVSLGLLALFVAALAMPFFLLTSSYAVDPGVGIGIRKDAPSLSTVNSTIPYSISVYNLGNYTITNVTITDTFPNQTTASWLAPDLAPIGQPGDSFNLTNILYTIRQQDVISGNPQYIVNHAAAAGIVTIQNVTLPVSALTNIVTFLSTPVVGGFTIHINIGDRSTPTTIYIALLFITAAALPVSGNFRRKHLTTESAPKR